MPWTDRTRAPRVLLVGSVLAAVLWLAMVVSSFWLAWSQNDPGDLSGFPLGTNRLAFTITSGLSVGWGYLLVAVVAFAAAVLLGPSAE